MSKTCECGAFKHPHSKQCKACDTRARRDKTAPTQVIWTYFISRDSHRGELAGKCGLWWARPMRSKVGPRTVWLATDPQQPGHIGDYTIDEIDGWFRVHPDTDLELLKVEQNATPKMLADAAKEKKKQ